MNENALQVVGIVHLPTLVEAVMMCGTVLLVTIRIETEKRTRTRSEIAIVIGTVGTATNHATRIGTVIGTKTETANGRIRIKRETKMVTVHERIETGTCRLGLLELHRALRKTTLTSVAVRKMR